MLEENGLLRSSLYFIGNFYEVKSVQFVSCDLNMREIHDDDDDDEDNDDVDDEVSVSWIALFIMSSFTQPQNDIVMINEQNNMCDDIMFFHCAEVSVPLLRHT